MRIIARSALRDFSERHPETGPSLDIWYYAVRRATWRTPADVKRMFNRADIVDGERVVFNIMGGNYRLIVAIKFSAQIVWIKFIGTHAEYDRVEARTVADY